MNNTKIEWAQSSWNPVTGCYHPCTYCYARAMVRRFGEPDWGGEIELNTPLKGPDGKRKAYPTGFTPTLHRYRLADYEKKSGRTIFVCSMADLFGRWVPDSWIEEVFAACEKAPQHRYLFLTKNPARYKELALAGKLPPKDNMWYGTTPTTPDQPFFYGGAWHTFASIEPLLRDYSGEIGQMCDTYAQWVIIGAETGNRKGKVTPKREWVREISKTCIEKNISLFMKESMLPIVGEENMFREIPWDTNTWEIEKQQDWLDRYHESTQDAAEKSEA